MIFSPTLKNKIRELPEKFAIWLVRLYFVSLGILIRQANKARRLLRELINLRLRLLNKELKLRGHSDIADASIHATVRILSFSRDREIYNDIGNSDFIAKDTSEIHFAMECKTHQIQIDEFLKYSQNDDEIKEAVHTLGKIDELVNDLISNAKNILSRSSTNANNDLPKNASKYILDVIKKTKLRISEIRQEILDRYTFKILIDQGAIKTATSLFSFLFIISGYLYQHITLGYFGINSYIYFSIVDYISASVDVIRVSLLGAILALIAYVTGIRDASRMSNSERKVNSKIGGAILVTGVATIAISLYFWLGQNNSEALVVVIVIVATMIAGHYSRIIADAFFHNSTNISFVILFIIIYSTYAATSIIDKISSVERGTYASNGRIFYDISNFDHADKYNLISSNSGYLFFYNNSEKISLVVRRQDLVSATIIRK